MIRICRQFFLEGHGEKTIPERYPKTQFESLGQEVTHPPTHLNIDTLSALVQRIPTPYFMSGSNSLKRGKEEPNKRTKQSNKFSTSPWQCSFQDADTMDWSDPVSHITGSFAGHSPSDMLKQYKFYFYWEGPRAHTQTQSFFLTVFAREKMRKGLSVVLPLDARIWNVENGVLLLSLAHPCLVYRRKEKIEKRQGTWL